MLLSVHVSDFGIGLRHVQEDSALTKDALHVRQEESHAQPVIEHERVHAGASYRNPLVLDGHPVRCN